MTIIKRKSEKEEKIKREKHRKLMEGQCEREKKRKGVREGQRERVRESERDSEKESERERVRLCVCARERGKEQESVKGR